MASEGESKSVQEAAVKSCDEAVTAGVKSSTASKGKSSKKGTRLAAEQPDVRH